MGVSDEIKKHFDKWCEAHKSDVEYDWSETGIAKESFTIDGVIDEGIWNQQSKKVLYILREANGNSSKETDHGRVVDENRFWFKECVESGTLGNIIFKRIAAMQAIIQADNALEHRYLLQQIAYMNLNKRGGGSSVDWKVLNRYVIAYKEYIKDEIRMLQPDVIVCCGTYWPLIDNVLDLYKSNGVKQWQSGDERDLRIDTEIDGHKCTIINMYHPSSRMSDVNYLKRFNNIYTCIPNANSVDNGYELTKEKIIQDINDLEENSEAFYDLCDFIININANREK